MGGSTIQHFIGVSLASTTLLAAAPVTAQLSQKPTSCVPWLLAPDPDLAISDCTALIQSSKKETQTGSNLAAAFTNRGNAYRSYHKRDYDRAIADFNEAIRLDPKMADAYYGRGSVYHAKGDFDRAIADYTETIRLDPKHLFAYSARGRTNFDAANYDAAASDLAHAWQQHSDPSNMLWLYLARARSGNQTAAAAELETNATKLSQSYWPYPVVELFLGRRTAEATLAAATKPEERCEAQYFIGEWCLLRGDRTAAMEPLKAAAETCPYLGAQEEIKRLGQ